MIRSARGYVPAYGFSVEDLRFCDAAEAHVSVKCAGQIEIGVAGVFRYYERSPCYAPQWADFLALRAKYIPKVHRPPSFDVLADGKPAGKPKSTLEEVAVDISGTVPLAAGEHNLLLVQRDIVDGRLQYARVGIGRDEAAVQVAEWKTGEEAAREQKAQEKKRIQEEQGREAAEQKKAAQSGLHTRPK